MSLTADPLEEDTWTTIKGTTKWMQSIGRIRSLELEEYFLFS